MMMLVVIVILSLCFHSSSGSTNEAQGFDLDFGSGKRWMLNSGGYPNTDAAWWRQHGYTGQFVGSAADLVSYQFLGNGTGSFPGNPYTQNSAAEAWRVQAVASLQKDISSLRSAGFDVFSTMDIFVIPATIVGNYSHKMYNGTEKRILLNNFTISLINGIMDEVFETFPELAGIVVRVGENYGGPKCPVSWIGNGAVNFRLPFEEQQMQYIIFITALRESVCVKHNKYMIFRTWDTSGFSPASPARFHPSLSYYLNVTNAVAPHANLIFSVKHVALDFWRWVGWNPCLAQGQHNQIVEVECQREYEGKGAMPSYIGDGVINGFPEFGHNKIGVKSLANNSKIVGMWTWASGGGWNGPHLKKDLISYIWPMTNALVLASWWTNNPGTTQETEAFARFCRTTLNITEADQCELLHEISLMSQDAILYTRYCSIYDMTLQGPECGSVSCMPTNNWMRDDRLNGLQALGSSKGAYGNEGAIHYLFHSNKSDGALQEKKQAISTWQLMQTKFQNFSDIYTDVKKTVSTSIQYGLLLSQVIYYGWEVMVLGYQGNQTGVYDIPALHQAISSYDKARIAYNATILNSTIAATPYLDAYEGGLNDIAWKPGLGKSVDSFRQIH
eukprot:m.344894 g.344894  ORF g.344894 m.344894 type:complete len:615 (-) comp25378_c0_seq1:11-1855(-)